MSELELQIKNPSKNADDFRVVVPATATVGDVKAKLQAEYPGNPDRSTITVRVGGMAGMEQWLGGVFSGCHSCVTLE